MPQKHLMIAVDWYGPYSLDEAQGIAESVPGPGLYLCIGRCAYERKKRIQYIGIGKTVHTRLVPEHHKLKLVTKERQIWLGEVSTAEPSGRKMKVTQAGLDYSEWLHARFLQLPLNEKKTKKVPPRSVSVMNRWFRPDMVARRNRPHADWPDLIDYPAWEMPARAVWFGGRQRIFSAPDYAEP